MDVEQLVEWELAISVGTVFQFWTVYFPTLYTVLYISEGQTNHPKQAALLRYSSKHLVTKQQLGSQPWATRFLASQSGNKLDSLFCYILHIRWWFYNIHSSTNKKKKQNPWSESARELYRPSNRRLSAKWLPTFARRGCHVVSVMDPYGRTLGFLDRSCYFSIK
jgi:hypothetical protein